MTRRFADLKPGARFESAGKTLSESEILDFALRYDPQPLHMDVPRAAEGPYGGLIASGIHTLAIAIRLMMQSGAFDLDDQVGSPGIEELRWLQPVRPGDTLHVVGTVIEARPSKSMPECGIVRYSLDVLNQKGEVVTTLISTAIMRRD